MTSKWAIGWGLSTNQFFKFTQTSWEGYTTKSLSPQVLHWMVAMPPTWGIVIWKNCAWTTIVASWRFMGVFFPKLGGGWTNILEIFIPIWGRFPFWLISMVVSGSPKRRQVAYNPPIGSIYHLYTTYILPSGLKPPTSSFFLQKSRQLREVSGIEKDHGKNPGRYIFDSWNLTYPTITVFEKGDLCHKSPFLHLFAVSVIQILWVRLLRIEQDIFVMSLSRFDYHCKNIRKGPEVPNSTTSTETLKFRFGIFFLGSRFLGTTRCIALS